MAPGQRHTKSSGPVPPARTLVVDNGAYTIKAGFSSPSSDAPVSPAIIPNCIARDQNKHVYIGSELSKCKDHSEIVFRRPVEKGYLVNWEAEKEIWEHEFFDDNALLRCDPKETGLILTEAPNALPVLQANCDQIVFEEFGFARYYRCPAPTLNAYTDIQTVFNTAGHTPPLARLPAEIVMLVDSGYSHTTITPLLQGRPLQSAIRRLDIGGKLMTNYLTRLLSLRHYDMSYETYLVNEIKEASTFVSADFKRDIEITWKGPKGDRRSGWEMSGGLAKDYILPDGKVRKTGALEPHDPKRASKLKLLSAGQPSEAADDFITLRNERFTVPELLFNPSDCGLRQSGIAQQIMDSLSVVPLGLWPGFLANIVCVGGNAKIDGFTTRLYNEVKSLAPMECIVRVEAPEDAIVSTWQGGVALARDEDTLRKLSATKQEYDEYGASWVTRKFGGR